jgi:hypothetical protein
MPKATITRLPQWGMNVDSGSLAAAVNSGYVRRAGRACQRAWLWRHVRPTSTLRRWATAASGSATPLGLAALAALAMLTAASVASMAAWAPELLVLLLGPGFGGDQAASPGFGGINAGGFASDATGGFNADGASVAAAAAGPAGYGGITGGFSGLSGLGVGFDSSSGDVTGADVSGGSGGLSGAGLGDAGVGTDAGADAGSDAGGDSGGGW